MRRHIGAMLGVAVAMSALASAQQGQSGVERLPWGVAPADVRPVLKRIGQVSIDGSCDLVVSDAHVFEQENMRIHAMFSDDCRLFALRISSDRIAYDDTESFFSVT